jgi:long-chain acyl-CoA synthetase
VQELIGKEVEAANKKFARVETIKKFRLIDQLLTGRQPIRRKLIAAPR